jgi:hypothetical protein
MKAAMVRRAACLLGINVERARERCRMGSRQNGQARKSPGMMSRRHPGHLPAPVVTNQMNARGSERFDDVDYVVNQPLGDVLRNTGGPNTRRVPALVERYRVKACFGERREHSMPGVA